MNLARASSLFLILFLFTGLAAAYISAGGAGDVPSSECNNAPTDDDNDGLIDDNDPGCSQPYYADDSEGSVWDTDLTSTMEGVGSNGDPPALDQTESIFFKGEIKGVEGDFIDNRDGGINETYIKQSGDSEDSGHPFLSGTKESHIYSESDFPDGTVLLDSGRAVDPPNPYGKNQWSETGDQTSNSEGNRIGSTQNCGDGFENDGGWEECPADYGDLSEDNYKSSNINSEGQTTECEPDGSIDLDSPSCGSGSGSCGDESCNTGSASLTEDNSDDNGNFYWIPEGDDLKRMSCSETNSETRTTSSTSCTSATETCTNLPDGSQACTCSSSSYDCGGGSSATRQDREFTEDNGARYNCNDQNEVYGGNENSGGDKAAPKADNDAAATFVDHTATTPAASNVASDYCTPEGTKTIDADGPRGYGDGFVVIDSSDNEVLGTRGPTGEDTVGQRVMVDGNTDNFRDFTNKIPTTCPGSKIYCLKYVDFSTSPSAGDWFNSPNSDVNLGSWQDTAVQVDVTGENTMTADSSYSACKMMNKIWRDNNGYDSGAELVNCGLDSGEGDYSGPDYEDDEGGDPTCEDEPDEYHIYMEGPEVNEDVFSEVEGHFQGCADEEDGFSEDSCVLRGQVVKEGYVGNVAPENSNTQYEEGGNSPDWEICLNIEDGSGDELEGDNYESYENGNGDKGGEWYDLDSENAQNYLRNGGSGLTDDDTGNEHHISYYWNNDVNPPQSDQFNPEGGQSGTALEDNCGNSRFDSLNCNDPRDVTDREPTFFSFFEEGLREDDFHPQGQDSGETNTVPLTGFNGVINRLQDESNQLEDGMDTSTYDPSSVSDWNNSVGEDQADAWAVSKYLNWSIDSTGVPYPPYSTYYRPGVDSRGSPDAPSRDKRKKAFANSYAAVAISEFEDQNGVQVDVGDGVWVDPDEMVSNSDLQSRVKFMPSGQGWKTALDQQDSNIGDNRGFKIDLTGPDSGLGIDLSPEECLSNKGDGGCKVKIDDTYWEQDDSGNIESEFEQPMCGDDRREFFIEEIGESTNPERYDGEYACSDSLNSCYDSSAPMGSRVVDQGEYTNTDEPGEDIGRLKNDDEICQRISGQDDFAIWYDQDYRESFCRQNEIYGPEGVRWFDSDYVAEHPLAVQGGIDDDWNAYMEQRDHEELPSEPGSDASEVDQSSGPSPVPTGDNNDVTATLGFCGGDDESEYLVTQECNTRYCDTDRTVQGVGKVPGSCVLRADNSKYETDISERTLFEPGEEVTVTGIQGDPNIACFNGAWYADWPVHFNQESLEVPVGTTRTASFQLINVRSSETTFEVVMERSSENPSADQFTSFASQSGDSFTATVPAQSSQSFQIEVTGGNTDLNLGDAGSDLTVRAEAFNSRLAGSDSISVGISEEVGEEGASTRRNVPGVGALHLVILSLVSSVLYFFRQ